MNTGTAELISIKLSTSARNAPLTDKQVKKNKKLKKKYRKVGEPISLTDIILTINSVKDIRVAETISINGHNFIAVKKDDVTLTLRSAYTYPNGIVDMLITKELQYARLHVAVGEGSSKPTQQ